MILSPMSLQNRLYFHKKMEQDIGNSKEIRQENKAA